MLFTNVNTVKTDGSKLILKRFDNFSQISPISNLHQNIVIEVFYACRRTERVYDAIRRVANAIKKKGSPQVLLQYCTSALFASESDGME
jgi:hypothetical protein